MIIRHGFMYMYINFIVSNCNKIIIDVLKQSHIETVVYFKGFSAKDDSLLPLSQLLRYVRKHFGSVSSYECLLRFSFSALSFKKRSF